MTAEGWIVAVTFPDSGMSVTTSRGLSFAGGTDESSRRQHGEGLLILLVEAAHNMPPGPRQRIRRVGLTHRMPG